MAGAQAHAQHPMKEQRQKTDQGVGTDTGRQSMKDRCDLDLALEHPKAALDIGQRLVARHHGLGRQIGLGQIRDQQQFAIEHPGTIEGPLVDVVAKLIGTEINPKHMAQMGIADGFIKSGRGPCVRELSAPVCPATVLLVKLAGPALGIPFQRRDALIPFLALLSCQVRPMGRDQPKSLPLLFTDDLLFCLLTLLMVKVGQDLIEVTITSGGHGQNELQWLILADLE